MQTQQTITFFGTVSNSATIVAPDRHLYQASRPGATTAKQHRKHSTPHRNLCATGSAGFARVA
ncbi:hypothetical protein [Granulicella sp. dw_53]|uniref:hypothetical protein n=1 Tax=Granulicella sp. dw_53 TaxID=2719792 RepID=UPI001BD59A88|nr:hypothetical protein [Granulicella sp. dw_53]